MACLQTGVFWVCERGYDHRAVSCAVLGSAERSLGSIFRFLVNFLVNFLDFFGDFFRWDLKQKTDKPAFALIGHSNEIFSIDFSPFNEYLFLTGSADNTIGLWDLRNLDEKLHSFTSHDNSVSEVAIFGPFFGVQNLALVEKVEARFEVLEWFRGLMHAEERCFDPFFRL